MCIDCMLFAGCHGNINRIARQFFCCQEGADLYNPNAFAVFVACFLFLGVASAQEYSIRANRGLNLRTAPSLNADIAETVLSGAVLQVVGKFNRWLKINLNGREVWLADWVNYSRVESGEPSGSQQPTAQIDNCCFVNRQCTTNQEWTDGYWAFQRNECPSGQPVAPVSGACAARRRQQLLLR